MHPLLQYLMPQKALSKIAHIMANCEISLIKNYLIKDFIKRYSVNLGESTETDCNGFKSFNDFFTRTLKPDARPVCTEHSLIASPADGAICQIGSISNGQLLQAKGQAFSLQDLVGGQEADCQPFTEGEFAIVYLSPKDYHRVHMPYDGQLEKMIHVPGRLFSVNTQTSEYIPGLFAKNERVVCFFQTDIGKMAVILVGAMIVGSIETTWHGTITPPHRTSIQTWEYTQTENAHIHLKKGEEMGLFKLGSTAIVLFEKNRIQWDQALSPLSKVQMGSQIGQLVT